MAISAIATILIGLARRIESSGVDYPNLVRSAAGLAANFLEPP
ncbi:MAG TPA: hypothetical protein VE712_04245 [Actinomycetota bacterium]|nr:hypothetical protein [Actinomycetota bacterium]